MVSKIKASKHPKPSIVYPREVYLFRTSRKETEGTEAMKTRPGIVISVEGLNKWNKRCIMVPATTKKTELAKIYPFEVKVVIEGKKGKAMIDQIKTYNNNENNNLSATAVSEDDTKTATVKKEENNTAAASDNSASSSETKNTATAEPSGTAEKQEKSNNDAGNNNTDTLPNDNTHTLTAQKEENNSLEQVQFEDKDQNAIDNRKKALIKQITEAKTKQETQSSRQSSSSSEENKQTKNNSPSPSTNESENQKPNQPTTNENSPKEKSQDIEKTIVEVQTQNSNVKEAKEIQNALTIAEKALASQNWQAKLFINLHAIKDGKPSTYQATKPQVDRAIQHLQQLQKQENATSEPKQRTRQENEKNSLTTGQKIAIGFGIFGGVILIALIISKVINSKEKRR
ncbi:13041_t:CDS:2 [Entrophospora sp. SA101]|nr:13041_t:CDS:2 [Entrophospora sp. SA101]CAJ0835631.1 13653_t:CDS:2 [Entrophospora sp. SA101]CAJ0894775.1 7982_t:CDS:2 [Entrophospora sp. SA101]